jgi:hypothetical protein
MISNQERQQTQFTLAHAWLETHMELFGAEKFPYH